MVINHLARKLRTRRGGARWFSILRYRGQASQRGFRKRPRIGVLVGSNWAEGATRLKLGAREAPVGTPRYEVSTHHESIAQALVGARQKGGGLDRVYALLRFALTSLLCHRNKICHCWRQGSDKKVEAQSVCCLSCCYD